MQIYALLVTPYETRETTLIHPHKQLWVNSPDLMLLLLIDLLQTSYDGLTLGQGGLSASRQVEQTAPRRKLVRQAGRVALRQLHLHRLYCVGSIITFNKQC